MRLLFVSSFWRRGRSLCATFMLLFLFVNFRFLFVGDYYPYNSRIVMPEKKVYVIQAASFPVASKDSAMSLYNRLKASGKFVYFRKTKIKNKGEWIRIRTGLFDSYADAAQAGLQIRLETERDVFITSDTLIIRKYDSDYAIKTPNAVWVKLNGKYIECFHFGEIFLDNIRENDFWADYTQPFLSPDKREVLFEYNRKIYDIDILTGKKTVFQFDEDSNTLLSIANSMPQKSPSGHYIGFIDANLWESNSNFYLTDLSNADSTRKLLRAGNGNAVKNFVWYPNSDIIFYVLGYAMGTVTVGGDIYVTDVEGNFVKLIESNRDKKEEITMDISVDKDFLYYKVAQHGPTRITGVTEKKVKLDSLLSLYYKNVKKKNK